MTYPECPLASGIRTRLLDEPRATPTLWTLLCTIASALFRTLSSRLVRSARRERVLGPYVLGTPLGEGGMGVVYRARHEGSGHPVAIKLLREDRASAENVARFEHEVELTRRLRHPNTVAVHDAGRAADGTLYYAMECIDGVDLQTLVDRDGPLPAARVAAVLAELCDALSAAHALGFIHRDVKPSNVMLSQGGAAGAGGVKLLDFGLSEAIDRARAPESDAGRSCVVGTPLYLAPEALTAPETMDGRSDLYAVGAVGYFLLTGSPPFLGSTLLEVCAHHLYTTPVSPSARRGRRVPARLEALILACLEKSIEDRPRDARALRDALWDLAMSTSANDAAAA